MDQLEVAGVRFLGEQDGIAEQQLKERLIDCLALEASVRKAFLVRVIYPGSTESKVSLCLSGGEVNAKRVVESVGKAFSQIFKATESLDVIFLRAEQVIEVSAVTRPFYAVR